MANYLATADKLLTGLLSDQAAQRSLALGRIQTAARNASTLEQLRDAIDAIVHQEHRHGILAEEGYRKRLNALNAANPSEE